jgi:hypothetical protein
MVDVIDPQQVSRPHANIVEAVIFFIHLMK